MGCLRAALGMSHKIHPTELHGVMFEVLVSCVSCSSLHRLSN